MNQKILLALFALFSVFTYGQVGPVQIIDDSVDAIGITKIVTADLNNDGLDDVVVSQGYNIGNISYYLNNATGVFSERQLIDANAFFAECTAIGDFNNDGWNDIVAITRQDGKIICYENNNGTFSDSNVVDSDLPFLNYVIAADFDQNDYDDIVVIGQHSIAFYKNNTDGTFTKEPILTTENSPTVLECMYLAAADMNADGHLDLITAETIGPVIYINSGTGNFTPQNVLSTPFITKSVLPFDIDGDGDTDLMVQNWSGQILRWFENDGNGMLTLNSNLFMLPLLRSMQAIDVDNDGDLDLYTAHSNKAVAYLNDGNGLFGNETIIHQNTALNLNEVALSDINNDGNIDYLWSALNGAVAYHLNENVLNTQKFDNSGLNIYPNPTDKYVNIDCKDAISTKLFNMSGQLILAENLTKDQNGIDVSYLPSGVYTLHLVTARETIIRKLIKK